MRMMRTLLVIVVAVAGGVASCAAADESQALTKTQAAEIEQGVRSFARAVAHDVTQEGPAAWRKHFADEPAFFMASGGQLVFANGATARAAIPELSRTIKKIELTWGDDLRVDALAPNLALIATAWHETRVNADGQRVEDHGYFTGIVEYRSGRWQFRNAHWSVAVPPSPVR
jgi:hypothetical protein